MTEYVMPLSFTRPPLNANNLPNRWKKAKITKDLRYEAFVRAKSMKLPTNCKMVEVTLHFRPRDNRRRDVDNIVPTFKPLCDGLVDAWIVHDDTPDMMDKKMPVIHPPVRGELAKCWLTIKVIR